MIKKLLLAAIAAAILFGCAYPAYLKSDPPRMDQYIKHCHKGGKYERYNLENR